MRKKLGFAIILAFMVILLCVPHNAFSQNNFLHFNKVIAKLQAGKTVTGIWSLSQSLSNARSIIEFNGFPSQEESMNRPMIDFILIAMEHYPYDITKLRTFLVGLNSRREVLTKGNLQPSLATFVRLPVEGSDPVHAMIKQVLDVGVHGVVIPHVRTADEALKIVKACRYVRPDDSPYTEPQGNRGYSPAICSYLWGVPSEEYYQRADVWPLNPEGDLMVIIMIEDPEGVKNINEILKVPGIGAVFFGPADYTVSSGNFGKSTDETDMALYKVKNACNNAGIPFVGFADVNNIDQRIKEKFNMLIIGSDIDKSGNASKVLDYLRSHQ
jgi:4-hydroxy-2-oxoheptanedioate aldolase